MFSSSSHTSFSNVVENYASSGDLYKEDISSESVITNLEDQKESINRNSLTDELRNWVSPSVPYSKVSELLIILKNHGHPNLPLCCQTHLQSKPFISQSMADGTFIYFGIQHSVNAMDLKECSVMHMSFNVDGLPIFKSNKRQFWCILCNIIDFKTIFPVAIYEGSSKPPLGEFLHQFVSECQRLEQDGRIKISFITCDLPAKAYIKNISAHNSKRGCDKCYCTGSFYKNRMTFIDTRAQLRTDHDFRIMTDQSHHKGTTPLCELPLDMVRDFPLD